MPRQSAGVKEELAGAKLIRGGENETEEDFFFGDRSENDGDTESQENHLAVCDLQG
jgi:hypothetical protein